MKKITNQLICLILVCVFVSSCGFKFSLTKRHYRDGYYVSNSYKNPTPSSIYHKKLRNSNATIGLPQSADITPIVVSHNNSIHNNQVLYVNNKYASATELAIKTPLIRQYKNRRILVEKPCINNRSASHLKQVLLTKSDDDNDKLSLVWIVIVVVLLLWALGYLGFALGAFIHLLLLVALILFILWILRLI